MLYAKQNFFNILLDECKLIEQKCDGYTEMLEKTVIEIIEMEKRHSIQGTNIRQQIKAIFDKAGNFLYEKQNIAEITEGDIDEIDQS
ncbi:hypothetical protein C6501_06870 [Candidatus Poribacteria bacterium]|nr:MAG: hypothetical protein C6501_06870 [Candidatus Poribacteria bacterium]